MSLQLPCEPSTGQNHKPNKPNQRSPKTTMKTARPLNKAERAVQSYANAALDQHTLRWWAILSFIALCNIVFWCYSYMSLRTSQNENENQSAPSSTTHPHQYYQLVLSGIYVFVCAYRSFLPRIDLERYCLFDTMLSSIFLGRTAATIAEIAFSCQIALFLHRLAEVHGHPIAQMLSVGLVPMIVIAQCFCWCGVISLNHLYHAIEESIWAVCSIFVAFIMGSFVYYHPENTSLVRIGLIGVVISVLFFIFMAIVDVPMYIRRWKENKEQSSIKGKKIIQKSSFEGAVDAWERRNVTKSWEVWREESMWLTGYFSSAVWLSLFLVHMPTPV